MTHDENTLHLLALCLENQRALIREVLALAKGLPPDDLAVLNSRIEKAASKEPEPTFNEPSVTVPEEDARVKTVDIGGLAFEFDADSPLSKLK